MVEQLPGGGFVNRARKRKTRPLYSIMIRFSFLNSCYNQHLRDNVIVNAVQS